jgi:type II secretory pathway pseudopilin PulG
MRRNLMTSRTTAAAPCGLRGFTIIELLTVVAIIIVLLSIVVVAVNASIRSAQRTNTQALMNSIKQGLIQFRSEIGYDPPVLTTGRDLLWEFNGSDEFLSGPNPGVGAGGMADYRNRIQQWYSITSLADYLLGYGPVRENGGQVWSPDGYPGDGIRNPGSDGYWGASTAHLCFPGGFDPGTYEAREYFLNPSNGDCAALSRRYREGRVYGPYLQLADQRLIGAILPNSTPDPETGRYRVFFAGEALPPGQRWEEMPKVIVDYWGQPIRYYRLPYPEGRPELRYRRITGHPVFGDANWAPPSMSHVIALRPFALSPGAATDAPPIFDERFADTPTPSQPTGDTTTSPALQAAEFALFSAGPDRSANVDFRVDEQEFNRDNIVEVGP